METGWLLMCDAGLLLMWYNFCNNEKPTTRQWHHVCNKSDLPLTSIFNNHPNMKGVWNMLRCIPSVFQVQWDKFNRYMIESNIDDK